MMKSLLVFIVLFVSFPSIYASEDNITEKKKQNIIKFMEITGTLDIGLQFSKMINAQLTKILATNNPNIPKEKYIIIEQVVNSVIENNVKSENGLLKYLLPIYDKYFTNEDLENLLAFYQSDAGKKILKAMPNIMQESMVVGQEWGRSLGPVLIERLKTKFKSEGYDLSI